MEILLTNDDGINSPGLWAAAEVLSQLGYVHVVAPRSQSTGAGRSLPSTSDGVIETRQVQVHGKAWTVYAVGGSPAQAGLHALYEILPQPPQLVVSGINFGENVGSGVTISGTVGAALEAAAHHIPALAVSLETAFEHHYKLSNEVDFQAAAHFTQYFAARMLAEALPPDVDVLKVEVPRDATPQTAWVLARQSKIGYYVAEAHPRLDWLSPQPLGYKPNPAVDQAEAGSDIDVLRNRRLVAVTPLSLDLTSRVGMDELQRRLA